jgi:hypothetical protein
MAGVGLAPADGAKQKGMVPLAVLTAVSPAISDPLAGWPLWIQVAVGVVAGALAFWLLSKLLKLAIWIALVAIFVGAVWMFWH